jgi:hypothetical protein
MLRYIISIWISVVALETYAQDSIPMQDTLKIKQKFGFRLGLDLSRPLLQVIQKQEIGFEITGDYRVAKNWYIATEIGYESELGNEEFIKFHTKGSYAKLGFNYNAYENWKGMNNEVYIGLRYGYSIFNQQLISYTTPDLNNYFGSQNYNPNNVFNGLTGHWAEINVGLKVEVLSNLFLTASAQYKKLLYTKQPDGFSNLYIPGFHKVLLANNGFGFNYTIAYLIPFYKKN